MTARLMENGLESIWMEVVVVGFKELPRYLSGRTDKGHTARSVGPGPN
jgi:hypothetical protein